MIEITLILLSIGGFLCAPADPDHNQRYLDEENEAEVIIAAEPLRGVDNLQEKSIPIFRLKYPSYVGKNNLQERLQIPLNLRGTGNLHEKGMPRFVLKTSVLNEDYPYSSRYPKNDYENL
ncbi:uncharacterized protein LOC117169194 [Belonocnema kinseyi]|uniref:uncharacterized protein LOC117169194 n=1 Tax=Belonocnema kinseyi TaxID=2817044 RepID=UPI00143D8B62|nr:uncharacterized protein LOC117169194 [Belonocnema kinseyi]